MERKERGRKGGEKRRVRGEGEEGGGGEGGGGEHQKHNYAARNVPAQFPGILRAQKKKPVFAPLQRGSPGNCAWVSCAGYLIDSTSTTQDLLSSFFCCILAYAALLPIFFSAYPSCSLSSSIRLETSCSDNSKCCPSFNV